VVDIQKKERLRRQIVSPALTLISGVDINFGGIVAENALIATADTSFSPLDPYCGGYGPWRMTAARHDEILSRLAVAPEMPGVAARIKALCGAYPCGAAALDLNPVYAAALARLEIYFGLAPAPVNSPPDPHWMHTYIAGLPKERSTWLGGIGAISAAAAALYPDLTLEIGKWAAAAGSLLFFFTRDPAPEKKEGATP
jgi:hypothetical protein